MSAFVVHLPRRRILIPPNFDTHTHVFIGAWEIDGFTFDEAVDIV
jgi:hypothetical protein